jgi:hypothetical protein
MNSKAFKLIEKKICKGNHGIFEEHYDYFSANHTLVEAAVTEL